MVTKSPRAADTPGPWVTDRTKCWSPKKKRDDNGDKVQCGSWPIEGSHNCRMHAGSGRARAHAAVRAEVSKWLRGNGPVANVDPGKILLQLLAQSAQRAELYTEQLEKAVDKAGGDLAEAMVGESYVVSDDGHMQKVGEYIRGLAQLEAEERDRCATLAAKAIAAGLAERQVRMAEQQGAMIAKLMRLVLSDADLGLTAEQRAAVPGVMRRHLQLAPAVA